MSEPSPRDTIAGRQIQTIKMGLERYDKELEWCVRSVQQFLAKEEKPKADVAKFQRFVNQLIERERVWMNWMMDANKLLNSMPDSMFEEVIELRETVTGEIEDVQVRKDQLLTLLQNLEFEFMVTK